MKRLRFPTEKEYTDCQDLAFHDFPDIRGNYQITREDLNQRFSETECLSVGTRVVYFDSLGNLAHFGLGTSMGKVISKKGVGGNVFNHELLDPGYDLKDIVIYSIPIREEFDSFLLELLESH